MNELTVQDKVNLKIAVIIRLTCEIENRRHKVNKLIKQRRKLREQVADLIDSLTGDS